VTLPPVKTLHWRQAWRIVPTRIPRINLYERLAHPSDQKDLIRLEQLTNPRVLMEKGLSTPLRNQDHFGPKASVYVKAAFANLTFSRFGNGRIAMLYAASNEVTAIAEKKYHDAQFWKAHHLPPLSEKRRALHLAIAGPFHDIRKQRRAFSEIYSPSSYTASQRLGAELWKNASHGIAYDSVRYPTGDCVAVFSPQTIQSCRLGLLYEFHWDGKTISETYRLGQINS
jgi:hypothetical protein